MSYFDIIQTYPSDSFAVDAFGRNRVSLPVTLFNGKTLFDAMPLFWDDQQVSGTASSTFNTNQASVTLAVNNTTAGRRVRRTFQHFNYRPGKSFLVFMSFCLGTGGTGITKRLGYGDDEDGLFLESVDGTVQINRRTNVTGTPVNNTVAQASWNLDVLDGSGPSTFNVDWTKAHILVIDFEWLGAGRVRFGLVLGGRIVYFHEMNHANSLSTVYMSHPNLPVQYELINSGTGAASTLVCMCTTVISEGDGGETSIQRGLTSDTTLGAMTVDVTYALIALRLKSAYHGAGIEFADMSFVSNAGTDRYFRAQLILNPTVASEPSFVSLTNSPIEYYKGTLANTITGGTVLSETVVASQNSSILIPRQAVVRFGTTIAGVSDRLVVAVTPVTNNDQAIYAAINWRELG